MKTRIGIFGYGNLGRGVENAIRQNDDMTLAAVFTRRDPASLKLSTAGVPVYRADDVEKYKDDINKPVDIVLFLMWESSVTVFGEDIPAVHLPDGNPEDPLQSAAFQ